MTKLYLFFVFFVSAVSLMAGPNTYTLINDKTYTWLEAKADAESRGGYLVTITTIDEENKESPFNDEEITRILNDNGYLIARRTVTKYRELMKISVSRLRKR